MVAQRYGGGWSRRRLLKSAAAAGVLSLPACGGLGRRGGRKLRFWNGFTGPDGRTMLGLIQDYNRGREGPDVVMQRLDWGIYYNKLIVAGLGGRGPEVFVSHASTMRRLAAAGVCTPLDALPGGEAGLEVEGIDANVLDAVRFGGRLWGLPLDVHPVGMYLNRGLLERVGYGGDASFGDAEGFVEMLRRVRVSSGGNAWGYVFSWLRWNVYTAMRQWGGDIFADDGRTVVLDSPQNEAALSFLVGLISEGLIPDPMQSGGFIGFRQGRVAAIFEGIYMLAELQRQTDLAWSPAALPTLGPRPAACGDSHVLCVAADLEPARQREAVELLRFLSGRSLEWAAAGQIPVRPALRETPQFREMTAQRVFATQIPHLAYFPQVPYVLEYQSAFDVMAERVLRRSAEPAEALRRAAAEIETAVARYESRTPRRGEV